MKSQIKTTLASMLLVLAVAFSIHAQNTDAKSAALLEALVAENGGYQTLAAKKDVQFHYVYDNFDKGKDVSTERHIFSWGTFLGVL